MESVQEAAVCPQVRKCRGEGSQPAGHMPTCPRAPRPAPRALLHMGSCSSTCLTLVCAEQADKGRSGRHPLPPFAEAQVYSPQRFWGPGLGGTCK